MNLIYLTALNFIVQSLIYSHAKVVDGKFQLDSLITENYITKFSFNSNTVGDINGVFTHLVDDKHSHINNADIVLYDEIGFQQFQKKLNDGSLCRERNMLARWRTKIYFPRDLNEFKFNYKVTKPPGSGKSHYFYIVVMDCSLEEYDAHPAPVQYHFEIFNGGSHLPADEDGMLALHSIGSILTTIGFFGYISSLMIFEKKSGQVHLVTILLGVAWLLQSLSISMELVHLVVYAYNGHGLRWRYSWFPLDFLAELFRGFSELILSCIFIFVAAGWTLGIGSKGGDAFSDFLVNIRKPALFIKAPSPASIFVISLAIIQFVLETAGRKYNDDFSAFHDSEHWPGFLLVLVRISLGILFFIGITRTLSVTSLTGSGDSGMKTFLSRLRILGLIWFISFPIVVLLASFLPAYHRNPFVEGLNIVIQLVTMLIMMKESLYNGDYSKVSTLNEMGNLFGANKKIAVD